MSEGLVQSLNSSLWQLGWNSQHPRVKAYLGIVAQRLQLIEFQSLADVPAIYLEKLIQLVNLYYQCDNLLRLMKRKWEDDDIKAIILAYGYTDKMPLKGYAALHKFLDDYWYEHYGF